MKTSDYLPSIMSKVNELFDYRMIPTMVKSCGLDGTKALEELKELQYHIFILDQYLEQNWVIDKRELNEKWKVIEKHIAHFNPISSTKKLMRQLRIYEGHEIDLRGGMHPEKIDIRYFYYYKSCDVKLMRKLILERAMQNGLSSTFAPIDWVIYDWVTEVNDDVTDLEEDRLTNNCNRLLYALRALSEEGVVTEYVNFLSYLEQKSRVILKHSKATMKQEIWQHTCSELSNTRSLLGAL